MAFLSSKVIVTEEEPRIRNIQGLPTANLGVVGVTERGPVGTATLVNSFEEYVNIFGGFTSNGEVTQAVQGFFENGGQTAYVVRTVHYTDTTDASTKTSALGSVTLQDRAGTPLDTLLVEGKTDGAYANALQIEILAATSGATDEFNLRVIDSGVIVETFTNLSMASASANYVETVVNAGSNLVKVTDQNSATASPDNLPALGTSSNLTGGDDGLTSFDANTDVVGSAAGGTGLYAFDTVLDLNLLTCPGYATSAVHNAMISYCETYRDLSMFAVLDPPADSSASEMVTYVETTASILGLSEFAAIYWPRIKVQNPNKTVFGNDDQIVVPPSGHICGVYARTDSSTPGGVYRAPAGVENGILLGCLGFETDEVLKEAKRDLVYPKRINPLTVFAGSPRHIDGSRTLKGDGNFPSVPERRGAIFIEQSVKEAMVVFKHKQNTSETRSQARNTVFAFLLTQMRNGAFSTKNPATAFFVDFSDALNPPSVVFAGKMVGRIGLATAKPAEFIELRFSQDTRALEAELAG